MAGPSHPAAPLQRVAAPQHVGTAPTASFSQPRPHWLKTAPAPRPHTVASTSHTQSFLCTQQPACRQMHRLPPFMYTTEHPFRRKGCQPVRRVQPGRQQERSTTPPDVRSRLEIEARQASTRPFTAVALFSPQPYEMGAAKVSKVSCPTAPFRASSRRSTLSSCCRIFQADQLLLRLSASRCPHGKIPSVNPALPSIGCSIATSAQPHAATAWSNALSESRSKNVSYSQCPTVPVHTPGRPCAERLHVSYTASQCQRACMLMLRTKWCCYRSAVLHWSISMVLLQ